MSEANAVRTVHVERLRLGVGAAPCRWISEVANAHVARKLRDALALLKDFGRKTVALASPSCQ